MIRSSIESGAWLFDLPAAASDLEDPLLASPCPRGSGLSMLGFDFHLSESDGPRLIEVNTNAGGLATLLETISDDEAASRALQRALIEGFLADGRSHLPSGSGALSLSLFPQGANLCCCNESR